MTNQDNTDTAFDHPLVNADVLQFFGERAKSWVRKSLAKLSAEAVECFEIAKDARSDADAAMWLMSASVKIGKIEGIILGVGCFPADVLYRLPVEIQSAAFNRDVEELFESDSLQAFYAVAEQLNS